MSIDVEALMVAVFNADQPGDWPKWDDYIAAFGSPGTPPWRRKAEAIAAEYARLTAKDEGPMSKHHRWCDLRDPDHEGDCEAVAENVVIHHEPRPGTPIWDGRERRVKDDPHVPQWEERRGRPPPEG